MPWRAAAAWRETFSLPIWMAWFLGLTTVDKGKKTVRHEQCSIYIYLFVRVSFWPITHCIDQAGLLKLKDPASASQVLRLTACADTSQLFLSTWCLLFWSYFCRKVMCTHGEKGKVLWRYKEHVSQNREELKGFFRLARRAQW